MKISHLNKNKKTSCLIALGQAMGVDPTYLETGVSEDEIKVDHTALEKEILNLIMQLSDDDRARVCARACPPQRSATGQV